MKTILKVTALVIVILIVGFIGYIKFMLPRVGAPENIKVELTPERIERGSYLANSVFACMDCHSKRDWNKFAGPMVKNTFGQGGEEFGHKEGFPGTYYAKNITPEALGDWTDGEILRAITVGVSKDGKPLFPVMPYLNYGKLDREDLYSIIAYLRTLKPVENEVPESKSDFPMSLIIHAIPQKAHFTQMPDTSDKIAYGQYLFTAASCTDCHTRQNKGKPVEGMNLAGGFKFPLINGGTVNSANITPDKETGIGDWTADDFVNLFKVYADSSYTPYPIKNGEYNTVMPWMMYSTMKESDLQAIFAYLQTVKPVKNEVVRFVPDSNQ